VDKVKRQLDALMADGGRRGVVAAALLALSKVYGGTMVLRADCYARQVVVKSRRLPAKVICVGNLTAGGTGKTPMAIHLARRLTRQGYRVALVSRGYGGRSEKAGGVVSDGRRILMDAAAAGDEPCLMARRLPGVPVVVGADRFRAGMLAVHRLGARVVVLDDAFQHLSLDRDFNLVLMDAECPLGNGYLLPRGTLREPVSALHRAQAVVLTRADRLAGDALARRVGQVASLAAPAPVFTAAHVSRIRGLIPAGERQMIPAPGNSGRPAELNGVRVLVFAGVARNDDVLRNPAGFGCRLAGRLAFGDHHRYSERDRTAIVAAARSSRADWLVTTEKDYVRFAGRFSWPLPLAVMGVDMRLLTGKAHLARLIDDCLC